MATGYLQVELYNQGQASPVIGGKVVVSKNGEVLYELFTNDSGQTETVALEAPPIEYSINENEPQPYETYDITVTADGYRDVIINGVQIFADRTALQKVIMTEGQGQVTINVPPPVLWGDYPEKEPEEEVKEIPTETGFVVLDRIVIPEYIVVKDGVPSGGGQVYYVPYKDYIKNVASSEIYSTWSDAAIRANVLAIQSFVLNRVFTEWYRNRGYNFTITNSTRYDQSYSQDRTIYENISTIVDEMFTNFLRREGQRQPLFAQYCDGRQVSCPGWMTQWGSEDLAKQGYSAIEILRYFYGDDIFIDTAEKVQGVPLSYPGQELTIGSTGNDVRTIQNQLNTISNTYSAIQKLRVDGIYGQATADAVMEFQKIFNLPQTGVVDLATWYQISQIYVAIERLAEL
ncbi:MAG: peptidoglycan-binding protein [Lachnospirales bacterium]